MDNTSLLTVKAVIILDSEGKRILSKYYSPDFAITKDQQAFEKNLYEKTKKAPTGEILMFDGLVTVYKNNIDVFVYVVGSASENELILASVLTSLTESLELVLGNQVERRLLLDNFDSLALTMDELIDGGIILESDPSQIASRVSMKNSEGDQITGSVQSSLPISEQTFNQASSLMKNFARSLLK